MAKSIKPIVRKFIMLCSGNYSLNNAVAGKLMTELKKIWPDPDNELSISCVKNEAEALRFIGMPRKNPDAIVVIPGPKENFWNVVDLARHQDSPVPTLVCGIYVFKKQVECCGATFVHQARPEVNQLFVTKVAQAIGIIAMNGGDAPMPSASSRTNEVAMVS